MRRSVRSVHRALIRALLALCLLAGCSNAADEGESETCTAYDSLCITGSVYVCQPGGQVTFEKSCDQCCVEGACAECPEDTSDVAGGDANVPDTTVDPPTGDATDTPSSDTTIPDTDAPATACTGAADTAALGSGAAWDKIKNCFRDCASTGGANKLPNADCIDTCIEAVLTADCAQCAGDWGLCVLASCPDECRLVYGEDCVACAAANCTPAFTGCAGIAAEDFSTPPVGEACTDADVEASATFPIFGCAQECEPNLPGDIPGFKACVADCLTGPFTAGCAGCFADYVWCFEDDCHDACGDDFEAEACKQCSNEVCAPPMLECGGIDVSS